MVSPRLLLTFDTPHLPSQVYLGFTKLDICHFIPALVAVFVDRFLAIRSLRVAVKRGAPIALTLPLVLIAVGPFTFQIPYLPFYLFGNSALVYSVCKSARSCPPLSLCLSYGAIINLGVDPS